MATGQFGYTSPAQAAELQKLESLKKQGHSFIRVYYRGRHKFPALHGFKTVSVYNEYDPDSQKQKWFTRIGDDPIRFMDNGTGDIFSDIYDCEHNRFALSRLINFKEGNPPMQMIEIEDQPIAAELRKLANKKYDVEPDKKTQLMRQRALLDQEIAALQDAPEPPKQEPEPDQLVDMENVQVMAQDSPTRPPEPIPTNEEVPTKPRGRPRRPRHTVPAEA